MTGQTNSPDLNLYTPIIPSEAVSYRQSLSNLAEPKFESMNPLLTDTLSSRINFKK
jgi:hypothetical protein